MTSADPCGCDCGCEPDGDWHWNEPRCACVPLGCPCVTDNPGTPTVRRSDSDPRPADTDGTAQPSLVSQVVAPRRYPFHYGRRPVRLEERCG